MKLTLRRLFLLGLLGLVAGMGGLYGLILSNSEKILLQSANQSQAEVSRTAEKEVRAYLDQAPIAVSQFEKGTAQGLVLLHDFKSLRSGLYALLLADDNLSEVSFTWGTDRGFDAEGNRVLAPGSAAEISVFHPAQDSSEVVCRYIHFDPARRRFVSLSSTIATGSPNWSPAGESPVVDPTESFTFQTPASRNHVGDLLDTDLHWSQLDDALPEAERRLELSVVKGIADGEGKFVGVLRVGLLGKQIEQAVRVSVPERRDQPMPTVFLCDPQGRLIAASFGDQAKRQIVEMDDDLRLRVDPLPEAVKVALAAPALRKVREGENVLVPLHAGGMTYLCTFRGLPQTQDWVVGVLAPRDGYLGPLLQLRDRLLWASLALIVALVVVGFLLLRGAGRALGLISAETERMNAFDFGPSIHRSRLADIREVLGGFERAKTAMRAMGKYVPVDLVRRLYRDGREPVLGGEAADLSLLFTDIKDFTVFSETTEPDLLARVLGRYLDTLTGAIQGERGTIDKYIGDAVMAFWNAPEPVAGHPVRACRAALRCREALEALYRSPEWEGRPRFETRFGLHRCAASVDHFGAADRFNYTAIGDGVNLAARLEGLNKYYGTTLIVSETVHEAAHEAFLFRRLDRVAVKGKSHAVTIYELVGEKVPGAALPAVLLRYEEALDAHARGDFAGALRLLEEGVEAGDGPSRFLAKRCRGLLDAPPAPGWDGVYSFGEK